MALGMSLPKQVFAHGWWTVEGEKMSKTLGNVIDPAELGAKYGVDPVRAFLFREVPFGQDGDFSMTSFKNRYNADLANNIGNLLSRTLNMVSKQMPLLPQAIDVELEVVEKIAATDAAIDRAYQALAFDKVLDLIYGYSADLNKKIADTKPWELVKTNPEESLKILLEVIACQRQVAKWITPFMPTIGAEMSKRLAAGPIEKYGPLFPRIAD